MSDEYSKLPAGRPTNAFTYWQGATDPGHRHSTPWWTEFYAKELLLYFPPAPGAVLECGCGTGRFYPWFKERCRDYVGVDFSDSMLKNFQEHWPEAKLVCADAAHLPVSRDNLQPNSFDFIFSNQVCQFFDEGKMVSHLQCIAQLLKPAGTALIGNIPDAQLRLHFYAGALRLERPCSWLRGLKGLFIAATGRTDGIGHWYTRRRAARMAQDLGFECASFSSASLEYRFHLLLRKN